MEKLPMCRICLVQNVRMFVLVNRNLRDLYEKLTDIPFVTEDNRPILACFFCCAKLKQCYQLLRQCLEAEELFGLMMNEDYEPKPLINQDHLEFYNGFIKSPTVHISIVEERQTEHIAIKEELPDVCEELDDNFIPKEEHQSHELELENFDYSCLDAPLMVLKTEVEEEQEISKNKKKQRAREMKSAPAAEKPKRGTRRIKIEKAITVEKKHELEDSEINQNIRHRTSTPVTKYKHPFTDTKHRVSKRFSEEGTWKDHIRIHTGEKPHKCAICQCCFSHKGHLTRHICRHTGDKPNKCDVCQRSFSQLSSLKRHIGIHTDDKPHKCHLCQRSFNDKRDLSKHIHIHNGEKPFKCDICQLSFNDKRDIVKHIRKHTGAKPFKCDICQRSFSYPCDLKKHIRIHTGEKPYTCEVCQHSFNTKSNLKKHSYTHC